MTHDNKIDWNTQIKNRPTMEQWAAALPIDSGAILPTSPPANHLFMHAPTGRRVLMLYTNSTWYPLYSFGTMTLYVDGTDGTDAADKGTGVDAAAYKTLAYMWTQLPSTFYGNITVNVAAGTYAETLTCQGKVAGGAYTISIIGTEGTAAESGTMTSAIQGSGATPGSITDTSKSLTVDAFKGYFIKYGTTIRVIKSNTATTYSIAGTFPGTPSGTYTVFHPGTIVTGGTHAIRINAQVVNLQMIKMESAPSNEIYMDNQAKAVLTNCVIRATATGIDGIYNDNATLSLEYCIVEQAATGNGIRITNNGKLFRASVSLIYRSANLLTSAGITIEQTSNMSSQGGLVVDGWANGILAEKVSNVYMGQSSGYCFVVNNTNGLRTLNGGQIHNTANNQYSGNTANETATAASFGYID